MHIQQSEKIYFFTEGLRNGGAEVQLTRIAIFLKEKARFDVHIIRMQEGNNFEEELKEVDIPVHFYPIIPKKMDSAASVCAERISGFDPLFFTPAGTHGQNPQNFVQYPDYYFSTND